MLLRSLCNEGTIELIDAHKVVCASSDLQQNCGPCGQCSDTKKP